MVLSTRCKMKTSFSNLTNTIVDVPGIKVGHAQDIEALTGCTVILCEPQAVGGVDQRGGAPGTREIDLLRPMHLVDRIDAVLLSGGSAFGLNAASGVVQYLEEQDKGYPTGFARVPIVPGAILYDLNIGNAKIRPDHVMGYQACINASNAGIEQGNFGAGTGASVGKITGIRNAMKSGVGSASCFINNLIIVGAIIAVNAFGDVINPTSNQIIAGARKESDQFPEDCDPFVDTMKLMASWAGDRYQLPHFGENTVIGVVATNALLTKEEANFVAMMSHDGLARTIRPAHTLYDGDLLIALSTGSTKYDVNIIGAFCAEVTARAVLNAVFYASGAGGLPSYNDIQNAPKKI
jgi:L-aminopeptidase/D-esterase-like protein